MCHLAQLKKIIEISEYSFFFLLSLNSRYIWLHTNLRTFQVPKSHMWVSGYQTGQHSCRMYSAHSALQGFTTCTGPWWSRYSQIPLLLGEAVFSWEVQKCRGYRMLAKVVGTDGENVGYCSCCASFFSGRWGNSTPSTIVMRRWIRNRLCAIANNASPCSNAAMPGAGKPWPVGRINP